MGIRARFALLLLVHTGVCVSAAAPLSFANEAVIVTGAMRKQRRLYVQRIPAVDVPAVIALLPVLGRGRLEVDRTLVKACLGLAAVDNGRAADWVRPDDRLEVGPSAVGCLRW